MGCGSSVNDATEPASPQDKYSVEESEKQSAAGGKATQGKEDVPATKKTIRGADDHHHHL